MSTMTKKSKKWQRGCAIVGTGMSGFGAFKGFTSRDLWVEAYRELCTSVDKGFDPKDIEALYVGNFSSDIFEGQCHMGPTLADVLGLCPIPSTRVEDACASGSLAFREAAIAISAGLYDIVLVGGVEKMTNLPTERVTDCLAAASDTLYEITAGGTFPGLYAAIATAHMEKYGTNMDHFLKVGIKNHQNGALNPKAQFGQAIPDIMKSRIEKAKKKGKPVPEWKDEMEFLNDPRANPVIAWPMRLFDCSPVSDGGACMLLVAEEIARNFTDDPIYLRGTGQASNPNALHARNDFTFLSSARLAAEQAYEMAGVKPDDIKIAEVHDCFTIAEIVATEDLGFFKPGQAPAAYDEGQTARDGSKPINTSGGLKSKGHPIGASGIGQMIEIYLQLRGLAGERQVKGVDLALNHNVGGTGGTTIVNILERR